MTKANRYALINMLECAEARSEKYGAPALVGIKLTGADLREIIHDMHTADMCRWHDLRKNPEDLPKCEHVVDIAFEAYGGKIGTARAFYEDGKMHSEDTTLLGCGDYGWDDWCDYCEETDDYIIPEGWIESVKFGDNCSLIDRKIIAWREIAPFEEESE